MKRKPLALLLLALPASAASCLHILSNFPASTTPILIYRNGALLTENLDYTRPPGTRRSFQITWWLESDRFSYVYTREIPYLNTGVSPPLQMTMLAPAREERLCMGANSSNPAPATIGNIRAIGDGLMLDAFGVLRIDWSFVAFRARFPSAPGPCDDASGGLGRPGAFAADPAPDASGNRYFYFCIGEAPPYVWGRVPMQTVW